MRRHPRADVAVYAPQAGPLYEPEPRPAGGAEVQSTYIARSLAEHGLRVRHIVAGTGLVVGRDGVDVEAIPEKYGRGGLARRRAALAALRQASAKVYIQRSAGFETALVGLHARTTRGRFVFSSSSVGDFTHDPTVAARSGASLDEWPTRWQYAVGLRLAHEVVVQTEDQRTLACTERGIQARVIPSFSPTARAPAGVREAFLWVGALVSSKDPLAYVDLARRVPEATFLMVAADRGEAWADLAAEVFAAAETTSNLHLLPTTAPEEVLALYPRAVAIVSTSHFEGFPNTFLEAWAHGTPALSLRVDPDRVIESHGLGAVSGGSLDELAAAARRFWSDRERFTGGHLRAYVERVHHPAVVGREWAHLVEELLSCWDAAPGSTRGA